ncbi:MAG: family 16 glycosylhydrolase [Phycisphaerales bacterium]|nr:family 16 glycosylhydrolase [Phycisphaerales bacterium]
MTTCRDVDSRVPTFLAFVFAATVATAQPQWEVLWADEFDGAQIDPSRWEYMLGDGTAYGLPAGWGNNELEYYTSRPENSFISAGILHIVARDERYMGHDYTSARLRTRGLEDIQYGRIEARMRVPRGQGLWPAFWMLPTDSPYGGWAASGEIDIIETINIPLQAHGTLHFGGQWPNNTSNGGSVSLGVDLSQAFHTYAIEWRPDSITWFIDGTAYHTVTSNQWWSENGGANNRAPFDTAFHMLLNVAVGGNWPGPPDGSTQFPQELLVDWVRVSKPLQTPYGGDAHPIPGRIEAEEFDEGWPEQAYWDSDPGNNGGAFRPDSDVDIEACNEGGYNIGWIRQGEWLEYTVEVTSPGVYRLSARVASPGGGRFALFVDGADRTGELAVPPTGGWQAWTTVTSADFALTRGEHILRFANLGDSAQSFNLNWIELRTHRPAPKLTLPH